MTAEHPDWEQRPDDSLDLPAEFIQLLRNLKHCHDSWYGHTHADLPAMTDERHAIDRQIDEYVNRAALPRWPFGQAHPADPR